MSGMDDERLLLAHRRELGRRERLERHVDRALLERQLHRRRLREVVDDEPAVLRRRSPVVLVDREDRLLARRELGQHVWTGADHVRRVGVRQDLVGREVVLVDDIAGVRRKDVRPDRERRLEVEDDRVLPLHRRALEVGEQGVDALVALDLHDAVERVLHVRRRHRIAVRELHTVAELARPRLEIRRMAAPRGEDGLQRRAVREAVEPLKDVEVGCERVVVVLVGRVDIDDGAGGPVDDDRVGLITAVSARGERGSRSHGCDGDPQ